MSSKSPLTTKTGADGRFEFAHVPPGEYTLTVSTIGYIFVKRKITVANADLDLTIPLAEGTGTYQETVTVSDASASRPKVIGVNSQYDLGSAALGELRGVTADDPMRAIQALPGVSTGDDFQASFSVRGSAFRHVGIVIDGIPNEFMLHAIRGTSETGSVVDDQYRHPEPRLADERRAAAAGRRLAGRDGSVRCARGFPRSLRHPRGRQRYEFIGSCRRPDRQPSPRILAGVGAAQLSRLAGAEDRAGRRQHDSDSPTRRPSSSMTSPNGSNSNSSPSPATRTTATRTRA
jgi:hypothetical protein